MKHQVFDNLDAVEGNGSTLLGKIPKVQWNDLIHLLREKMHEGTDHIWMRKVEGRPGVYSDSAENAEIQSPRNKQQTRSLLDLKDDDGCSNHLLLEEAWVIGC